MIYILAGITGMSAMIVLCGIAERIWDRLVSQKEDDEL